MKINKLIVAVGCIGLGSSAIGQTHEGRIVGSYPSLDTELNVYMIEDVSSGFVFRSLPINATLSLGDNAHFTIDGADGVVDMENGSNNHSESKIKQATGKADIVIGSFGDGR